MKTRKTLIGLLAGLLAICSVALAQPGEKLIKVHVAPQHGDWVYKPGETVKCDVSVTKNDVIVK